MNVSAWLVDTVTVASVASGSSYNDPSFGVQRAVKCRLISERTTVKNADGSEANSEHTILTNQEIRLTDLVWLPGTDPTKQDQAKTPITVSSSHDRAGRGTLYKVLL